MFPNRCFSRALLVVIVLAFCLAQPMALFAQDELPTVICDRLSDDDCLLLQRSHQAMNGVTTAHSHTEALFQLAEMPKIVANGEQVEIPAVAVELTMDNAYSFDDQSAEQWQALAGIDQNVMGLAAVVSPESILQIFAGLTAETRIRIRLSDAVQSTLAKQTGESFPPEINLNLRVVDNQLYIDLDAIAAALDAGPPPAAWGVIDLADLWALPAQDNQNLRPSTVFALLVGIAAARNNEQLISYYDDLQQLGTLDRQLAPGRIVRVERGDDQTLNGLTVAQYTTNVDVRRLVTWGAGLLQKLLESMDEEIDPSVMVGLTMGPSLLSGVESTFVSYIEPATARIHRQENAFVWDFTPLLSMANLLASQSGNEFQVDSVTGQKPQLELRSETDYDYAAPLLVAVPEDVIAVPLDEVFGQR